MCEGLRGVVVAAAFAVALAAGSIPQVSVAQQQGEGESTPPEEVEADSDETGTESQETSEGEEEAAASEGASTSGEEQSDGDEATETRGEKTAASDGGDEEGARERRDTSSRGSERAERYEVEELVRRAKTNEDLLDEFEAKRDEAEWKRYRAKWAPTPKIRSLTTVAPVPADADPDQINRNYEEIGALNIGPFVKHDLNFVVPVFGFGRIQSLRKLADIGIDVTALKKREAQLNVIFQTKRAYYSLQLSQTVQPILQKGDQRVEEKLQEMEDARDFGEADFETKDFRKLQIFSARVDTRISENQKLADVSTSGLKYLADLSADRVDVGEMPTDEPLAPIADFDVYFEAAKTHHPKLKQLDKGIEARKARLNLQKRQFFPKVFIAGGLGAGWSDKEPALERVCRRDGSDGPCENTDDLWARPERNPFNRFSFNIAAGLRWNLDPVQIHGKIQEKKAKLRATKAQKQRALGAIRTDLRAKYSDVADQRNKVEINDRRLEAARKWRNQKGLTMETAGKDLDEMDDAIKPLKAFYKAKAKFLESRYRYKVARAALAQGVGVVNLTSIEENAGVGTENGAVGTDETANE